MTHHKRGLRLLLKDDVLLNKIESACASEQGPCLTSLANHLDPKRIAMLRYAIKLTQDPAAMERADVAALADAGFSDTDILHIAEVVGYFAFVNRIADGLGVLLES